jgi:hypothetical protein
MAWWDGQWGRGGTDRTCGGDALYAVVSMRGTGGCGGDARYAMRTAGVHGGAACLRRREDARGWRRPLPLRRHGLDENVSHGQANDVGGLAVVGERALVAGDVGACLCGPPQRPSILCGTLGRRQDVRTQDARRCLVVQRRCCSRDHMRGAWTLERVWCPSCEQSKAPAGGVPVRTLVQTNRYLCLLRSFLPLHFQTHCTSEN